MSRGTPFGLAVKSAETVKASLSTAAGRIAAASVIVVLLAGVVTAIAVIKPYPALIAVLVLLVIGAGVLAAVAQQDPPSQSTAAAAPDGSVLYDPRAPGVQGAASFWTREYYGLSELPYNPHRQSSPLSVRPGDLVDRAGQLETLRQHLRADGPNVFVVYGPAGAGKSTLVNRALHDAGLSGSTVRRYNLPGRRFDAKKLYEEIAVSERPTARPRPGEDVLSRLEKAMEAPAGPPVSIVVSGAGYLLDRDTRTFSSFGLELAEAIGVIAAGRRRVKLVLMFREAPRSAPGSEWLASPVVSVAVGGLAREDFLTCLLQLDPGLAALTTAERSELHSTLQGFPQLAELFCTVLRSSPNRWNASSLVRRLAGNQAGEAERVLAEELVNSLTDEQRCVLTGLAAYGTPVTGEQLEDLLEGELAPGEIDTTLKGLTRIHVVSRTANRYYLSAPQVHDALTQVLGPDGPAHLWRRATDVLSASRKEDIRRPEDLELHFAELDILILRQLWGSSYELINVIEKHLRQWNATTALVKYRENIAGKLHSSYQEMVNYNALGCSYLSDDDFDRARQAFSEALQHASAVTDADPHGRRKICLNLASLHLSEGDTGRAETGYRDALALAGEHDDKLDRMVAMVGLSDCFRRHGQYDEAISYGKSALCVAQAEKSSWAADIAIKLARWHSELDQRSEAHRFLEIAQQEALEHPNDRALPVRCLDGQADLLLDDNRPDEARDVARRALDRALELNNAVTVVQARTTMAMACLLDDDAPAAGREINRAVPYRRPGRSLVLLALQALTALQIDPRPNEAKKLFEQLKQEAAQRRKRDQKDFAAWDFEGLAICGTLIGQAGSLDPAIAAFGRARGQAMPPGLNARMRSWLAIVQAKAQPGQLDPVLAVVFSPPARPERS
jgi:tetratricopeptide (TPR) repeat protein